MSEKPKDAPKPADPAAPQAAAPAATNAAPAAPPGAKLKPPPLSQIQIAEQVIALKTQKEQLTASLSQLSFQLNKIQTALKESDTLRERIKVQCTESYSNFKEEFKRKSDFFPEIRFQMIQKATESLTPKK